MDETQGATMAAAAYPASVDGAMIALYPDAPLDTTGADTPTLDDQQHLTLCLLGEGIDGELVNQIVTEMAADCAPVEASVTGIGVFNPGDDGYPVVALIDSLGLGQFRADLVNTLIGAGVPYATDYDFIAHLTLGYDAAAPTSLPLGNMEQPVTFSTICLVQGDQRVEYELTGAAMDSAVPEGNVVASASEAPVTPPAEWFDDPQFQEPTPLTITDEGQIYGHAAIWDSCHMSKTGYCITPPHCDYSLFHLGCVETTEGILPTGKIVMGEGGHADLHMDVTAATQHYDKMNRCAADVRAGEDEWGIWFSGALRPGLPDETIRELRASPVSGDWRKGDLIALLAVNIGAFPVPRALVASAESGPEALAITGEGFDPGQPLEAGEQREQPAQRPSALLRSSRLRRAAASGVEALAALARE